MENQTDNNQDFKESYGIPILFYDEKITSDNYDIIENIFDKIICINAEIDYFVPLIIETVKKIKNNGGFTLPKLYKIYLRYSELTIYDGRKSTENLHVEEFWIYRDLLAKLNANKQR